MSSPPDNLEDRSAPATPDDLFRRLDELGIAHETTEHEPVFTVEEAKTVRDGLPGGHTKNLFLRNKKGAMWLVVCEEDRLVDLKALARHVGAGRFSFSSADRLMRYLGVIPGAVSPFAVINDKQGRVRVVVDLAVLRCKRVNFHPLDNARTTAISGNDLVKFLRAEEHAPEVTDFGALEHTV
ncbi:MAG: prolyl-tRNA synthetase associated domain-containing protein [Acidobacteriota bacterium]|jgi:Ala-tRNA(Pro) deacylase